MNVRIERFEDVGTKDAEGFFDYYYSGRKFFFVFAEWEIVARVYDDSPRKASILSRMHLGSSTMSSVVPERSGDVSLVAKYLRSVAGAEVVSVFVDGVYVTLNEGRSSE